MAINDYTPEQIEEILQAFFDVAGTRQYIGARYVPIFGRGRGTSVDWDNSDAYEPLSIVYWQGDTYTSRRYVPAGIAIDNQDYWVITGRYNAQVEQYRQEVLSFQGQIDDIRTDLESDYVPFPDADHYPKYGTLGQVLTTLADGDTKWENPVVPSDAQAEAVITEWLNDHPEATTTVQDNSITDAKLNDNSEQLKARVSRDIRWDELTAEAMRADKIDLNSVTFVEGKYLTTSGAEQTNAAVQYTQDYIPIPKRTKAIWAPMFIISNVSEYTITMIVFYDANHNVKSSTRVQVGNLGKYAVPTGAVYFRANFSLASGSKILFTTETESLQYTDYVHQSNEDLDDYTDTGFYLCGYTTILNMPNNRAGTLAVFKNESGSYIWQLYATNNNDVFSRFKTSDGWQDWKQLTKSFDSGLLYEKTINIVAGTTFNTGLSLKENHEYYIVFSNTPIRTSSFNIFSSTNASNYKSLLANFNTCHLKVPSDGFLNFYSANKTYNNIHVRVYDTEIMRANGSIEEEVFTVGVNTTYLDYGSFTQCLLDIKNISGNKKVILTAGIYNIYQEYVNANVPVYTGDNPGMEYWDYCVFVPNNTHVFGQGEVTLKWEPDPTQVSITPNQCRCVSTLNTAGDCTIENVTLTCKNGRYCIHDDTLGKIRYNGATKRFINVKTFKYENDIDPDTDVSYGFTSNVGFGNDVSQKMIYEKCEFYNTADGWAFYGHSRGTDENGNTRYGVQVGLVSLANCIFDSNSSAGAIKFGNGAMTTSHIDVNIYNSYSNGKINLINEGGSTPVRTNRFKCLLMGCNPISFTIADQSNPYPPTVLNTIGA